MTSSKIEGVSMKRLSDGEKVEISMAEFLKSVISQLPNASKVNDEIKAENGDVFRISSLEMVQVNDDNSNPLPNNDGGSGSNTSTF